MAKVAIVGAGLSGLVVARGLHAQHDVVVFDKSRGVGGRMATRYAGPFEFDHGAQFFTARSLAFREFLAPLVEAGVVANWNATFAEVRRGEIATTRAWDEAYPHYVGAPRMNAIGKYLAHELDVRAGQAIESVSDPILGDFDWRVIAVPAAQAAILAGAGTRLEDTADSVPMLGCFALMLGFDGPVDLPWQAALVQGMDISWISLNSSKPGRPTSTAFVVHSTNAWAEANMDTPRKQVLDHLLGEFSLATGIDAGTATHVDLHRWRYANVDSQAGAQCLVDEHTRTAACGDWFVRGRVEAAFTSGHALLGKLRKVIID